LASERDERRSGMVAYHLVTPREATSAAFSV
jgi:hypothetical protein